MKIRNEVKIGLITVTALILAYLGINFLKGINLFDPENKYIVRLSDLSGTSVATPVMISGYKVGSVQQVNFGYTSGKGYGAELVLGLGSDVQIPRGSTVKIKTNLLSGATLEIVAPINADRGYLSSGDEIPFSAEDDIMVKLREQVLPQVTDMLPEISHTIKRLNNLANNPAIDSMLANLNHTSVLMTQMMAQINTTLKPMPQMVHNTTALSQSLANVGKTLEQLPLDSLVSNLNQTSENLQALSAQLKSQEGTLGKLMGDPSLYNRLDSLASSADALMKDLKANPKRYVHFSLFGRKSS